MPSQYATVGAVVTAATIGQVICVVAGNDSDSFFNLVTKGLTLQVAQAGIDARTRAARSWAVGDPLPSANETVSCRWVGGFGVSVESVKVKD